MSTDTESMINWQTLGQPPPSALRDARDQLHWAVQVVASVGYTLVEPVPDWSHTSLVWNDLLGALVGQPASGPPSFQAALRLADLTLLLLDEHGNSYSTFALDGCTLDEGYAWLAAALATLTDAEAALSLVHPDHELPAHPVASGQTFSLAPPEAFAELARWYANADRLLQALRASSPEAPAVLVWPHHFDVAVLLPFDAEQDAETERYIGVGLVPGDAYYAEPYWYITPGPAPDDPDRPPLEGGGFWRSEGWRGAVLTGSTLVAAGEAEAQAERAQAFVRSAIAAARTLPATTDEHGNRR